MQRGIKHLQKLLQHLSGKKNWNHVSTISTNYCLYIIIYLKFLSSLYNIKKPLLQSWQMVMDGETQTPSKKIRVPYLSMSLLVHSKSHSVRYIPHVPRNTINHQLNPIISYDDPMITLIKPYSNHIKWCVSIMNSLPWCVSISVVLNPKKFLIKQQLYNILLLSHNCPY